MCEPVADQQLNPPSEPRRPTSNEFAIAALAEAREAGIRLREDSTSPDRYDVWWLWNGACDMLERLIEFEENK